jgi:hypothetical protein
MARTRFKVLFGNACQVLNGARRRHSYPDSHITTKPTQQRDEESIIIIIINIKLD